MNKYLRLRKQKQVKYFLDGQIDSVNLPPYEYYDEITQDGKCGKERPDFVWDCGTHKVILEVDEYQHKDNPPECENTRMKNITQAFYMPCLWIRYNPDKYKGWRNHVREKTRLIYLWKTLEECFKSIPETTEETLRVVYLFYDNFKISKKWDQKMLIIDL
jgi:hypothetical protein